MNHMNDWDSYEELAQLLQQQQAEADASSVYPVGDTPQELDFSWLVMDEEVESTCIDERDDSISASPVSLEPTEASDDKNEPINEEAIDLEEDHDSVLMDEVIWESLCRNKSCQDLIKTMMEVVEQELSNTQNTLYQLREIQANEPTLSREFVNLLDDPFAVILRASEAGKLELSDDRKQIYQELQQQHSLKSKTWKWTKAQRRQLALGIRQQNQKMLMNKVIDARGTTSASLTQIQKELETIKSMDHKALELNLEGIDYDKISRLFVPKKSAIDCELQWRNQDHPLINKDYVWTNTEVALLKEHGDSNSNASWADIANMMGTNRTAFSCIVEYQRRFKPHRNRGKWTLEEDAALRNAVARFGEVEWSRIATFVPGRDRLQCLHRWSKTLSPSIRKGKWTREEDESLRQAVTNNPGGSWQEISMHVPGRTDVKCRERWTNVLDPNLKRSKFTAREDRVLMTAVQELGQGRWSAVAARLPGRTDNQCFRRWSQLMKSKKD